MIRFFHVVFIALVGLGMYGSSASTCLSQGPPLLGAGGRTVPGQTYDLAQRALASGSFTDALEFVVRLLKKASEKRMQAPELRLCLEH